MNVFESTLTSPNLIAECDRFSLQVVVLGFFVTILDLMGMLLLCAVTDIAAGAATGDPIPTTGISAVLDKLPAGFSFDLGLATSRLYMENKIHARPLGNGRTLLFGPCDVPVLGRRYAS